MLDMLRVLIPFKEEFCFQIESRTTSVFAYHLELNVKKVSSILGITTGVRTLERDSDMVIKSLSGEYIPYESVRSSYTGISLKFNNGSPNIPASIEIKASPAKIVQGHNVFGSNSIELGYLEMCSSLSIAYPDLMDMLDFDNAETMQLDSTFFARVDSEAKAKQVISHMSNVAHGQIKASKSEYETTCYHNKNSAHWSGKSYSKYPEFEKQMNDYKNKAEKGDKHALLIYEAMSEPRLHHFTKWLVRFEATILRRKLIELNLPTKVKDLIKYQKQLIEEKSQELIENLWHETYGKLIKNTFRGQKMNIYDDELIQNKLRLEYQKITPKGNISYSKADRAFSFYRRLVNEGYSEVKRSFSVSKTFYNNLNLLIESGFSKAQLQNLQGNGMRNVVPLVEMITVDFSQQFPEWYQELEYGPLTQKLLGLDNNVVQLRA